MPSDVSTLLVQAADVSEVDETTASAVAPAPTLSSLTWDLVDTAGGGLLQHAIGTNFITGAVIVVDGVDQTTAFVSATELTCTMPAHAAGSVNVHVRNPDAQVSSDVAVEYWIPTQIVGTPVWFDAERDVTEVAGAISAWGDQGIGGVDATQGTGALQPTWTASAFGALHSVRFARASSTVLNLISQTVGIGGAITFRAGIKSTGAIATATDAPGVDAAYNLFGGSAGGGAANCGMGGGGTAGNVAVYAFDGVAWQPSLGGASVNDGSPHIIGANINGTSKVVQATLDGASVGFAGTLGAGGFVDAAGWDSIGAGFAGLDPFDGDVGWVLFLPAAISGADDTKLTKWSRQRWGTS